MNENDLRVRRTRNLLKAALIELVATTDYRDISVRDLTDRAQVGYRTFFHHYESKDALLQSIADEVLAEFLEARVPPDVPGAPEQNTLLALHYASTHAEVLRLLLKTSAAEQFLSMFYDFSLVEGKEFFRRSDVPEELVAHHFASSVVGFLRWWLEHDMPFPMDEMADYINRLLIWPLQGKS